MLEFLALLLSLSIVNCRRFDLPSTEFQINKDTPKSVTVAFPRKMPDWQNCQLGLLIEVGPNPNTTRHVSIKETDKINFTVQHPNFKNKKETFEVDVNHKELQRIKILHRICLNNCKSIDTTNEMNVFATTNLIEEHTVNLASIKGADPCIEIVYTEDPWKIPAIISVIFALFFSILAVITVFKVKAISGPYELAAESTEAEDEQEEMMETLTVKPTVMVRG